jgi:hypothetical protein
MRRTATVMAVAAALCAAALPAAGQETPEQVVERYYETFRSGDYAANAAMMDPDALEELKSTVAQLVETVGDEGGDELRTTFGVGSAAELRALAPEALYERMLRATLGDEEMRDILQQAEIRVLGHVPEGEDVAHVVYRMRVSFGGVEVNQVQIAPVRRTPAGWRVMLTGSLAGMMQGLGGRQ